MTPEQEIERAGRAHEILDNEVFKDAVNQIRNALHDGLIRTALVDEKLREKICFQLVALEKIVDALRTTIDTGKLAQKQLEIEQSRFSKLRNVAGF